MDSLLLLLLLMAVLIVPSFLMQRRQKRRMDEITRIQEELTIGQRVITTAGMHATVRGVDEKTVELEVAPGVVSVYEKIAIVRNLTKEQLAAADVEKQVDSASDDAISDVEEN
ncbi:preprotein translocase [Corynebacterium kutscheri]|uniref:Preprotein translocase n=1 Tax=Corynebacterium kutscheri TaxID=35755 RepID=A0A0F6TD58_9CORY|nr:preprotein translocase subunit YajC [Corynebacterium kutscheri]AKE41344.1 preprotein translocase, YajC subunit [Corynebacterium kutscheri]VEH08620.1 preprotein translocase [Corynebacterium kutscheri]VEH09666.1 preprotein translocase [Corynebacterium kutscheri]VEH79749.1 preprotein translocase [Corynebacterium kutscheri]